MPTRKTLKVRPGEAGAIIVGIKGVSRFQHQAVFTRPDALMAAADLLRAVLPHPDLDRLLRVLEYEQGSGPLPDDDPLLIIYQLLRSGR